MTPTPPREIWISGESCLALVEEAIRDALGDRFLKGTVKDAIRLGRRRAEELLNDYDQADDEPRHHRGPAGLDCPIACLGLTAHAYNRLTSFHGMWPEEAPATIADVLKLAQAGRLRDITGIGKTHANEIARALRRNGHHVCPDGEHAAHNHGEHSATPGEQPSPHLKEVT